MSKPTQTTIKTILVVDDEPELREIICDECRYLGHVVLEASNGLQALEVLKNNNVDVVLSDVRMPGGDGVALLKGLKTISNHKPKVFMMSGFSDYSETQLKELGAEGLLSKPFDIQKIIRSV